MDEKNLRRVQPQALKAFCADAFVKAGMTEEHATITAEVLVATDMWGIFTHGTYNAFNYIKKIRAGGIDPRATPEVIREGPCWAVVDGHSAIAMVTSVKAMGIAIEKAKVTGLGYVGVRESNHFGGAAYYANMSAEQDLIGLAMTNTALCVTAPGAKGSVIGNNPLGYAVPAGKEPPLLFDIAMSLVAGTKLEIAKKLGKPIPDNWMVDEEGLPSTDLSKFPLSISLMPMAGHKGYGLALMVEVLAGVLTGAGVTSELISWGPFPPLRPKTGHAFLAISVDPFMPLPEFKDRMDKMIRGIKESPKAKGAERIFLPGEMEWEKRAEALMLGIALPEGTIANHKGLAEMLRLDLRRILPEG